MWIVRFFVHVDRSFVRESSVGSFFCGSHSLLNLCVFVGSFFLVPLVGVIRWIISLGYSFVGCMWASLPFVREFHVDSK
jgi:hypothetical protein